MVLFLLGVVLNGAAGHLPWSVSAQGEIFGFAATATDASASLAAAGSPRTA
jgi:hypothetical protein